jgi:hypothetical protein
MMKVPRNSSPSPTRSASTSPPRSTTPAQQTSSTSPARVGDDFTRSPSRGTQAASQVNASTANSTNEQHNAQIRAWYNQQVSAIPELDAQWKAQGVSAQDRAKAATEIRHNARIQARDMMRNPAEVEMLRQRDMQVYGNPDGPTFDQLVQKAMGKGHTGDAVYEYIIGSSNRTNAEVNARYQQQGG